MERTYDIFEVFSDGTLEWRDCVAGHEVALAHARGLAAHSTNEFRVMHLPTNSVVAVLNGKKSPAKPADRSRKPKKGGSGRTKTNLFRPGWHTTIGVRAVPTARSRRLSSG